MTESMTIDPVMMELFRSEVETHVANLNRGLLALEQEPGGPAQFEALMRAAHSIKGAARIVRLDGAVKIAHAMEDIFVAAQKAQLALGPAQIDVLLKGADALDQMARAVGTAAAGKPLSEETAALAAALEAIRRGEPVAPQVRPASAAVAAPQPAPVAAPEVVPTPAVLERTAEPAARPAATPEGEVVRVSAVRLNSLMDLTGESLVRGRWLVSFAGKLAQLRKSHGRLQQMADRLAGSAGGSTEETAALRAQLRASRDEVMGLIEQFEEFELGFENLADRLHEEAIGCRMRPFVDGVQAFPRMVRDIARKLDKKVRLEIVGEATRVDRDVLEKLEAPLTHLLRNALDHGMETPDVRRQAGKPETGRLVLEARHHSGMLLITLTDDGRGIDLEKLRKKVMAKGLVSAGMAGALSEEELLAFLFLPGFSTSDTVTEYSGRGVGLDIVQNMVQTVGGSVQMTTQAGQGTTVSMLLPVTLSVIRALLVDIQGEPYAFRLAQISRCLRVKPSEIRTVEDRSYVMLEEQNVALVDARQVLALPTAARQAQDLSVVVIAHGQRRFGVIVDRVEGERELVVRPLDARLGKVPSISAAAVTEDGSPVLIMDVDDMVHMIEAELEGGRLGKGNRWAAAAGDQPRKRILVVDDSPTVREVERRMLEGQGYLVNTAVDGMDAWNALLQHPYDLVVTDMDMPRMNGAAFIARLRADGRFAALPVIIVSYKDRDSDREAGLKAGAQVYLTKASFQDESLLAAVRKLTESSGT